MKYHALPVALSLLLSLACRADTIFLTDGSEVNGTIVQQDSSAVVVKLANGTTRSIRRSTIETIIKEAPKVVAKKPVEEEIKVPAPAKTETPPTAPGKSPIASPTVPAKLSTPAGLGQPQPSGAPAPTPSIPSTTNTAATTTPPANPANPVTPSTAPTATPETSKVITPTPETPTSIVVTTPDGAAPAKPKEPGEVLGQIPIEGFPENTKRMSKRKESLLRDALDAIKGTDDAVREAAVLDMQGLGAEVVPYCWAGVQNENASVRMACMRVLGGLNARNTIKRVIETFYMTMPATSQAATWNVPFVRTIKNTVASLTGQSYITVEPKSPAVQEGLRKYVEWYEKNYDRLPRQVGEPDLDPTDAEYPKKLAEARKLKLTKREWPRPGGVPVDLVSGPSNTGPGREPQVIKDAAEREVDKKFLETVPKVGRDELSKREPVPVPERGNALKRPQDAPKESTNTARDPAGSGEKNTAKPPAPKAADALKRPSDLKREEDQRNK